MILLFVIPVLKLIFSEYDTISVFSFYAENLVSNSFIVNIVLVQCFRHRHLLYSIATNRYLGYIFVVTLTKGILILSSYLLD
jgi:hypothetical protein